MLLVLPKIVTFIIVQYLKKDFTWTVFSNDDGTTTLLLSVADDDDFDECTLSILESSAILSCSSAIDTSTSTSSVLDFWTSFSPGREEDTEGATKGGDGIGESPKSLEELIGDALNVPVVALNGLKIRNV